MIPRISIFNDVIGPVMRGPSSSHTAAGWRVANMAMQLLNAPIKKAKVVFDKNGQWATNYEEQGTVLGMNGGFLDIPMADDRMKHTASIAKECGINIRYEIGEYENNHANSMLVKLESVAGESLEILAVSLGGGSFELQKIDGIEVNSRGDYHLLVIWSHNDISEELHKYLPGIYAHKAFTTRDQYISIVESSEAFPAKLHSYIAGVKAVIKTANVKPVMPIISGKEIPLPFSDVDSLVQYSQTKQMDLGELGLLYETSRSGMPASIIRTKMREIIHIIHDSIRIGLNGTQFKDRILPQQSNLVEKAERAGKILQGSIVNTIVQNVAAIMEAKSALEVIVANPTAGSCGTVGAAIKAVADELQSSEDEIIDAYFAAGLVGVYFAMGPGFSAEEHGCQVETGASAGMAAAAIVNLFGGSAEQALGAASIAIQNTIGLVCDPIADRVEAPCLGKNTAAAVNALSSATMAASGFAHLIPLDQVLETVQRVSAQMPSCNKCTGEGGLAITPAAKMIKEKLSHGIDPI